MTPDHGHAGRGAERSGLSWRWRVKGAVASSVVLVSLACAQAAVAATKSCRGPVTSGLAAAPTEADGKKAAIQDWIKRAKSAGAASPSWSTASERTLKCVRGSAGGFECAARASPCTIKQSPTPSPPSRPKRRLKPSDTIAA